MDKFLFLVLFSICIVVALSKEHNHHNEVRYHKSFRHHTSRNHKFETRSDEPSKDGITLIYRPNSSLIGVVHEATKTSLIFEYSSNCFLLINPANKTATVVDAASKTASLKSDVTKDNEGTESLFQKLPPIHKILKSEKDQGKTVYLASLNESVRNEITTVCSNFGIDQSYQPLDVLVDISNTFFKIRPVIKLLLHRDGQLKIVNGGLLKIVSVFKSFGSLLNERALSSINSTSIPVDLAYLYSTSNGPETFLKVLDQIGSNIDISKLGPDINNPETLLHLISDVSTNNSNIVDIVINIIYDGIKTIILNSPPEMFIDGLIRGVTFLNNSTQKLDLSNVQGASGNLLKLIERQSPVFKNANTLKGLTKFIQNIHDNNLVIKGVDVFRTMATVNAHLAEGGLHMILRFIMAMKSMLNPFVMVPKFIRSVISNLHNQNYFKVLSHLFPGINPIELQKLDPSEILENISSISSTSQVPVVGSIFSAISKALSECSGENMDLQTIFSSGANNLKDVFQGLITNAENNLSNVLGGNASSSIPVGSEVNSIISKLTNSSAIGEEGALTSNLLGSLLGAESSSTGLISTTSPAETTKSPTMEPSARNNLHSKKIRHAQGHSHHRSVKSYKQQYLAKQQKERR